MLKGSGARRSCGLRRRRRLHFATKRRASSCAAPVGGLAREGEETRIRQSYADSLAEGRKHQARGLAIRALPREAELAERHRKKRPRTHPFFQKTRALSKAYRGDGAALIYTH